MPRCERGTGSLGEGLPGAAQGSSNVYCGAVQGTELISQLASNDIIKSAKLISGGDRLVNAPSYIAEKAMKSSVMYGLH